MGEGDYMRRRELSTILKEFERDMRNIFKDDFRMVWKQAYEEVVRLQNEINEKSMKAAREQDELMKNLLDLIPTEEDKPILKKFYRVLANTYHPDNKETGNAEMMGYVNDLKQMWGI